MAYRSNEPSPEARETTAEGNDDSGFGLVMFVVFSAAVLLVTGTVALLALIGSWWMLGAAFAVHAGTTAGVTFVVIHAMSRPPVAIRRHDAQGIRKAPRRWGRQQRAALAAHR